MYYHKGYQSRLYLSLLPCLPRSAQVLRTACPLVRPFLPLPTLIHVEGPRQRTHPLLRGSAAGEQTDQQVSALVRLACSAFLAPSEPHAQHACLCPLFHPLPPSFSFCV